jgi:hypothetical protein
MGHWLDLPGPQGPKDNPDRQADRALRYLDVPGAESMSFKGESRQGGTL